MRGLILSAGLGERLRPLTLKRAKPAIEFLNMPMLTFPYYWLNTLGLKEVVFNTHYLPETVRHAAMHVVDPGVAMHFTHEPAVLGSGGGIWNARLHLQGSENFAVANGDGVILCEDHDVLTRMLEFHIAKNALATLLVCPLEGMGTRLPGVWMDAYGEICSFGKKADQPAYTECFHYASYMLLNRRIWDYLPDGSSNILYDVILPRLAEGERAYGYLVNNMNWFETGSVNEYLAATGTCLEHARSASRLGTCLENILDRHACAFRRRTDFQSLRLIADSAEISPSAALNGFVVIGDGVRVGPYAQLDRCVALPKADVPENGVFRETVVI